MQRISIKAFASSVTAGQNGAVSDVAAPASTIIVGECLQCSSPIAILTVAREAASADELHYMHMFLCLAVPAQDVTGRTIRGKPDRGC